VCHSLQFTFTSLYNGTVFCTRDCARSAVSGIRARYFRTLLGGPSNLRARLESDPDSNSNRSQLPLGCSIRRISKAPKLKGRSSTNRWIHSTNAASFTSNSTMQITLSHNSIHRERWIDMTNSIWKMENIWLLKPLYLARVISSKRGDIFRETAANSVSRSSVDASICYRDIAFMQHGQAVELADLWCLCVRVRQFFPSPDFLSTTVSRHPECAREWNGKSFAALHYIRHERWAIGKNIPRIERLRVFRVTRISRLLLCPLSISLAADYRGTWRCPSRVSPGARRGGRPIKWIPSRSRPMRNTAAIKVGTVIVDEFPLCVPSAFVRTAKAD